MIKFQSDIWIGEYLKLKIQDTCWQDDDLRLARLGRQLTYIWLSARLRECQAHHLSSNYTNNGETQLSFASVQKLWAHENVQCAYRRIPPLPPAWPQGLCDILWRGALPSLGTTLGAGSSYYKGLSRWAELAWCTHMRLQGLRSTRESRVTAYFYVSNWLKTIISHFGAIHQHYIKYT